MHILWMHLFILYIFVHIVILSFIQNMFIYIENINMFCHLLVSYINNS